MNHLEIIRQSRVPGEVRGVRFNPDSLLGWVVAVAMAVLVPHATGQASVLTQHNDNGRTGQNTQETILNTSNVNVNEFGKLFSLPVVGQIYAQPLYVPGVTVNGGIHNVLIVATEEDYVYAFDADSAGAPLWTASLVDIAHGAGTGEGPMQSSVLSGCNDLTPNIGITGTPVIDSVAGTIYVVAKSTTGSTYIQRLHTLNLATGAEKSPGPAVITASVPGTGDGSSNGTLAFDPLYEHNRPGLLLLNGSVFIAYASHCDSSPYHGWILAYNASTLAQQSVFVTTPNGGLGGFWMAGAGLAADSNGFIYAASGNGTFDSTNVPATELGDTIVKLSTTNSILSLQDYFTPSDQLCLATDDTDLGSGGVLVVPDPPGNAPHILVAGGKEDIVYAVNRDQMTLGNNHFENSNNCTSNDPQILEESRQVGGLFSIPAYWNNSLYYWTAGDMVALVPLVNGVPQFSQITRNSTWIGWPGATPSISSNGTTTGTAILWGIDTSKHGSSSNPAGPAVLYAIDAVDINSELWNSTQSPGNRDTAGNAVKFAVPTVANGKVYIGTSSEVDVYGLFPRAALTSPAPSSKLAGSNVTFSWTPGSGGVSAYELWLGTTGVNSSDAYNSGSVSSTSVNVTGLPTNGVTLYARLWTRINNVWQSVDYTYTEAGTPAPALMTSPAPGSMLSGSSATFSWTAGSGPTQYELWLSSVGVGQSEVYNSGAVTATSASVSSLPVNGVKLYARLWSRINGNWQSIDYTYTEAGTPAPATLTSPAPGSVLSGSSATFSWTSGSGPTQYELWLSSVGVGQSELYNSGAVTPTSANVNGLPANGVKLYARLWSRINGNWQSIDYTYTEAGTPAPASMTSPAPGSVLTGPSVAFSWTNGSGPTQYELWLSGVGVGQSELYNSGAVTATSANVNGLPANGVKLYARLWSRINGNWQSIDYTYTEAGTPAPASMTSPAPGSVLTGPSVAFSWTNGSGPTQYELWLSGVGVGQSEMYNSGALMTTSANVSGLPTNGVKLYARLWSRINGNWQSIDYTYTAQ